VVAPSRTRDTARLDCLRLLLPLLLAHGCATARPDLAKTADAALDFAAQRAQHLIDDGLYAQADSLATAALAASARRPVSDSLAFARLLDVNVEALLDDVRGGTDPRAEAFARRSCGIRERLLGADHPDLSISLCLLARVLMQRDAYPPAIRAGERAVAVAEAATTAGDLRLARALYVLGRVRYNAGDLPGADSLARRAHEMWARLSPPEDPGLAETAGLLGIVALDQGRTAAADSLCRLALDVSLASLGETHPQTALRIARLGVVRMIEARFAESDSLHRIALSALERWFPPDHPIIARQLFRAGNALAWGYHLEEAVPYQQRALAIFERRFGPDAPAVADVCSSLGDLYSVLGDPAGARPLLERALAIRERVAGPMSSDVALSLDRLGEFLLLNGEAEKARPLLERSLAIRRKLHPAGHLSIAWGLERLARCDLALDRNPRRARPLLDEAIPIFLTAGPEHPATARGYGLRSYLLVTDGRYREALEDEKRSLAIYAAKYGERSEAVAWGRYTMACAYWGLGDWEHAREAYRAAATRFGEAFGSSDWAATESQVGLGVVLMAEGRYAEAFEAAMRGLQTENRFLRVSARLQTEEQGLRLAAGHRRALHLALSLAAGPLRDSPDVARRALDAVVRERALVLDEMASRHRVYATAEPGVDSLVERFEATSRTLANLSVRAAAQPDPSEGMRARLESARRERDRAERDLAQRSWEFRREQAESRCGLPEVAQALEPGSALVSFVRFERVRPDRGGPGSGRTGALDIWGWSLGPSLKPIPAYLAFVLRGGERTPRIVSLGDADELDALVASWRRQAVTSGAGGLTAGRLAETRYRAAALGLRQAVWDRITKGLYGIRCAYIVPDGALCLVNFATLPVGRASYLVEHDPILHCLSAERDLALGALPPASGRGLLAVGAPDFDARPDDVVAASTAGRPGGRQYRGQRASCDQFRSMRFPSLPGSGEEVEEIASLWKDGEAERLVGAAATEAAFKALAPGHEIVHIATHGFFVGESCPTTLDAIRGIGGTVPADADDGSGSTEPHSRPGVLPFGDLAGGRPVSPLLLSGLALAGANHRDEFPPDRDDGILTAEEIAAMDLSGVRWAVLSACETGVGEVHAGEGVLGLRRAFQVAGARTTIMSLWWVDDEATRRWMRALYTARLKRGFTTSESVREAALSMLRDRRARGESTHPFAWGAFVASGDWR
jgi:CHAT domain-containing protein/tetratricopeptide (TPR) repeat protein